MDQGACAQARNIDIYRLQEELVERGTYAKFSHQLSGSASRKRALDDFGGELRCIWWLDKDLVEIARQSFPEVGESFDILWNVVRAQLTKWRDKKLEQNTNTLWYDSNHTLLSDKTASTNRELRNSLKELFRNAMIECEELYRESQKTNPSSESSGNNQD